jgi:hypothetical protein
MNLLDVYKELNTEDKCLAFLEKMRWPDGVKCLSCESSRITRITSKGKTNKKSGKTSPDRELYQCNQCRFQFTATTTGHKRQHATEGTSDDNTCRRRLVLRHGRPSPSTAAQGHQARNSRDSGSQNLDTSCGERAPQLRRLPTQPDVRR